MDKAKCSLSIISILDENKILENTVSLIQLVSLIPLHLVEHCQLSMSLCCWLLFLLCISALDLLLDLPVTENDLRAIVCVGTFTIQISFANTFSC